MILDRLVWFIVPADQRTGHNLWISQWQIAVIAVMLEVLSFVLTFTGGVIFVLDLTGYGQPAAYTGYGMLMLGLALQLAGRVYLVASSLRVAYTSKSGVTNEKGGSWDTGTVLNVLTISGLWLMFRDVYRVAVVGSKTKQHTWMLYLFDALAMAVVLCGFAIVHPGQVLPVSFTTFRLRIKNDAMMVEARRKREPEFKLQPLHGEAKVVCDVQHHELEKCAPEATSFTQQEAPGIKAATETQSADLTVTRTPSGHGTWV